jgi:hypothetical protein
VTEPARRRSRATRRTSIGSRWRTAAVAVALGLLLALAVGTPRGTRAVVTSAAGEFHPVAVTRVFDSRSGAVAPAVTVEGASFSVDFAGAGGVLPADRSRVLGVFANITVTDATVDGFLATGPSGDARPATSSVNFVAGSTVANLTLLRPGADGRVDVTLVGTSRNGRAHVVVDVSGYLSSAVGDRGSRFVATTSTRLFDSRRTGAPIGPAGSLILDVRGADGFDPVSIDAVPDDASVEAVALTLTVDNQRSTSADTWVSIVPESGATAPSTSNLNLPARTTRANLVIVPLAPDGSVRIYNAFGSTDVIVDLVGYFRTDPDGRSLGGRIIPLEVPARIADSRPVPLAAGQTDRWDLEPFLDELTASERPVGAVSALVANLTATRLTRTATGVGVSSYLTVHPSDAIRPGTSNVNVGEGADSANSTILGLNGARSLSVFNALGSVDYVIDVFGIVLADRASTLGSSG